MSGSCADVAHILCNSKHAFGAAARFATALAAAFATDLGTCVDI